MKASCSSASQLLRRNISERAQSIVVQLLVVCSVTHTQQQLELWLFVRQTLGDVRALGQILSNGIVPNLATLDSHVRTNAV